MSNRNTITLTNNTDKVIEIKKLRGIICMNKNDVIETITVQAHKHTNIDPKDFDGNDNQGGQLASLEFFCDKSLLLWSKGDLLAGEQFFSTCFKTVTIEQLPNQNLTGVVNYQVKFEPRSAYASVKPEPLKAMTLDLSKLFASKHVDNPETSLLNMVKKFWPRTFTDLNRDNDLWETVRVLNDLMRQAKSYNVQRSKVKVEEVEKNVRDLNKLCAAKVEWYRPLFPGMKDSEKMAEVDREKLEKFATAIKPLLRS